MGKKEQTGEKITNEKKTSKLGKRSNKQGKRPKKRLTIPKKTGERPNKRENTENTGIPHVRPLANLNLIGSIDRSNLVHTIYKNRF